MTAGGAAQGTGRVTGTTRVRTARWRAALLAAIFAGHGAAHAALDNKGTEFIVSFLSNTAGSAPAIEVHLTADAATSVLVEYPVNSPSFSTTVPVTPGAITVVGLPTSAANGWPNDVPANNAVRLSAPGEFVAYMINRALATSDAALALPVDTMNTEYIVSTYNEAFVAAQFVVTAAFDGTTVTITPSNATQGGHPAGVAYTKLLNRGQGVMVRGATNGVNGGLAGTIVTADKPVGLTNGNDCTQVPIGVTACDHIFEVAQPTQTWGTAALVANLPNRPGGSIYRVVASVDSTTVSQDGAAIGTINRGQYLEVGPLTGRHVFSADEPVFVTQYMTGQSSPGATLGDPAMGNMIPTAQYLTAYTFSTVGGGQFAQHFLTVVANDADLATITLDGVPIGAGAFSSIPGTGFSAATVPLPEGTHSTSSASPHGITVEGYNGFDSYLYPGGALFQFINPVGDANPPLCQLSCSVGPPAQCSGQGQDDRPSEDLDDDDVLDPGEDLNGNDQIDEDTGVFFVELGPGSTNLTLTVPPFVPGAGTVPFSVGTSGSPASGTVIVTDGAGNTCQAPVAFDAACGDGFPNPPVEECDDGNTVGGDGCSATCQEERCDPPSCDDGNPCTDDSCEDVGGQFACVHAPNTDPCDDGSACTIGDTCAGGECHGAPLDCNDQNPCTNDVCDPQDTASPCEYAFNGNCPAGCGDLVVGPGETCDPPNLALDPGTNQTICRLDCTQCGDGVVQGGNGETCDDGNTVEGCDPRRPLRELDPCRNNCSLMVCEDPAQIQFGSVIDQFKFHGRLSVGEANMDFATQSLRVEVTNALGAVVSLALPPGSLLQTGTSHTYHYTNGAARRDGGIYKAKARCETTSCQLSVKAYGQFDAATVSDMTTHVFLGSQRWTVRANWAKRPRGWRLNGRTELLPPL